MIFNGQILSDEEKKIIHEDSLRILCEIGVRFPSHYALDLLEAAGAKVDRDKDMAFFNESMIKNALSSAPKSFVLGARNEKYNFRMPSSFSAYNLDGAGVNMLDFETGRKRSATIKDVAQAARVFDEIDLGYVLWAPVSPCDTPIGARSLINTAVSFMNTCKHVQDEVKNKAEVPYAMEIAKAILGDMNSVRERKIYSSVYCTVAPLSHDCDMLEATMELSKYDVPIVVYPMPACGTTGPASLYSNIAMANAEALSAITIFQLVNPKTPIIYGAALGVVNIRNGMFLEGAPETALQLVAMGEMGKYYSLPTIIAGCLTDAKTPGMQSVMEKFLTTMPLVASGVDVVQGIGLLEGSMTLSFEHMIIDAEIAKLCQRLRGGVDICTGKNYFEDIKAVGPGGHFLKQKSTRSAFRSDEFYQTSILDRGSYDEWLTLGSPDMFSMAHEKVKNILAKENPNPLPSSVEKQIKEILEEAAAKL